MMATPRTSNGRSIAAALLAGSVLLVSCGQRATTGGAVSAGDASDAPTPFTTQSGIAMVWLPGGTFTMGDNQGDDDEKPEHTVRLSAFAMDTFEVTHAMFAAAQLPNPSKWQDAPDKPVNQVRWRDAKQYCNERSILEGLEPCYDESIPGWPCDFTRNGYRLPTEAEWEYAARCGTRGDFPFGPRGDLRAHAWFAENSGGQPHPAGSRKPNQWGIHDLYGNLSEWCHDVYDPGYYASSPEQDPTGPEAEAPDARHVVRGGSWKASARMCRVSFRQAQTTGDSDACFSSDDCGFRCVRRIAAPPVVHANGAAGAAG